MISTLIKESWDDKVIELGGSILQSWAWGEFNQSLGQKIYRNVGEKFANLSIATPLPFGKKYLYCPRGPIGDSQEALLDIKSFSEDRDLIFARLEPSEKMDLPPAQKETQPLNTWVLDISETEQNLLIKMKPKHRYNLNLALRKGVIARKGEKKDLLGFWKLMLETSSRNNFKLHPQNYYWTMWEFLHPNYLDLLLVEYQGKLLAGMLITYFGDTATYLHGGSTETMKAAMAPYLLHWEGIRLAREKNLKFYDFGGIVPGDSESHVWSGISRFKKGFGGFEVKYPGSFDLVYSPIWYNVYKQARIFRKLIH